MEHKLIIMSAPAGSGKSYWAHYIQETHDDCWIVSRDKIRFGMLKDGDDYFKYEHKVEARYYELINKALRRNKYVIADATQITKYSRQKLFDMLYIPYDTKVIGIYIEASEKWAKEHNSQREGRALVPEEVIEQMFDRKVTPQLNEGYDEIIYVNPQMNLASGTNFVGLKDVREVLTEI